MTETQKRRAIQVAAIVAIVAIAVVLVWQRFAANEATAGLVSGNGRIEAVEIDVATKIAGRVKEIRVGEGEFVKAGQILAVMDTETLEAQRRQAEAELQKAQSAVATARSQLRQRQAEREAAAAAVTQREAELEVAQKRAQRSADLAVEGATSQQQAEDDRARALTAAAALSAARAQVAAAEAAIITARSQVDAAQSTVTAARATVERIAAEIADSVLKAPRDGRVQYIVARTGEVLGAGGRVLNLIDLSDVYMTFFLPTAAAGRIAIGTDARIMLDAAPEYVIPARISFIADVAQFTPKTVETAAEREKLMFRVRARIPEELLRKYITQVKTGLPGVAYVLLAPDAAWPAHLQVNLPDGRAQPSR